MLVVRARNICAAYPRGLNLLAQTHDTMPSRNGPVLVAPEPVSTHYDLPTQRVLFDVVRDANPFFHCIEALWMLAGREDVDLPAFYVPGMRQFSDDGVVFHGAYGKRWRAHWEKDQLRQVVAILRADPTSRRAVVQMWDPDSDLNVLSKDLPCNLTIVFQISRHDALNMTVFNRSNDAILGCYGANVVHFSMLQEYMAAQIGVDVGWYEQVSTNFHAYVSAWKRLGPIVGLYPQDDPYRTGKVFVHPLVTDRLTFDVECDTIIRALTRQKVMVPSDTETCTNTFFHQVVQPLSEAYYLHRQHHDTPAAIGVLDAAITGYGNVDWLVNGRQWMLRRLDRQHETHT